MNYKSKLLMLLCGSCLLWGACSTDDDPGTGSAITEYEGFTLVWSDEFEGASLDRSNWTFETGDGTDFGLPAGWGNSELQLYTENQENISIQQDGDASVLAITAQQNGTDYSSTKITTRGLRSIRFGKVEARIKLPSGQGIWPAFWMLGDNFQDPIDWPGSGEIDIMEMLGHDTDKVYSTVHFTNSVQDLESIQGDINSSGPTFDEAYHLYTLDWTPEKMTFYVDGILVNEVNIEDDMKEFLRSFYLILNVAVGGNWPGSPDETTSFPTSMLVDFVRVYQWNDLMAGDPPALDLEEETWGQFVDEGLAVHAIQEGFDVLGQIEINSFGGGGEPEVTEASEAIDGASSLQFAYPGSNWGGAFFEMDGQDMSAYSSGHLNFSLKYPDDFKDVEVKLESSGQSSAAAVFLVNYTPEENDGWMVYKIPMADFEGLDLTNLSIVFALWNPTNQSDNFLNGNILLDNLYFSED